jgi:hypothetical protein
MQLGTCGGVNRFPPSIVAHATKEGYMETAFGLSSIISNGRGGWLCSACSGGVRSDATSCKHCHVSFVTMAAMVAHAHTIYQAALETLKAAPTSADLRQKALSIGRAYSNLTRNKQGVTVYDEMALMNDIDAATAGATKAEISIEDRLQTLEGLRSKGLVSDAEYSQKRQKLLDEM